MRGISGLAAIVLMSGCSACFVCYAHAATRASALAPVINPFLPALEGGLVVTLPAFRKALGLAAPGQPGAGTQVVAPLPGAGALDIYVVTHLVIRGFDVYQLLVTVRERAHGAPIVRSFSMTFDAPTCISAQSLIAAYGLRLPLGPPPIADPPPPGVHRGPRLEPVPDRRMKYARRLANGSIWANFADLAPFEPKCVWRFGLAFGKASR